MPKEDEEIDPIIVAELEEDKEIDPIIVAGLDEDGQKDQQEKHKRGRTPSVSPGRRERKFAICIHPKVTSLPPT